jgi:hypothetical protein
MQDRTTLTERQPRHPRGAPASQGGRFAASRRPRATVTLPSPPLGPDRLHALARALEPASAHLILRALAANADRRLAEDVASSLSVPPGPPPNATADDLAAYVQAGQAPVVLYEVLDHPSCSVELALKMMSPDFPVDVRAEVVRQGWPGAARKAVADPHPFVRALAIGAWDLDATSADALRHDVAAQKARAQVLGQD